MIRRQVRSPARPPTLASVAGEFIIADEGTVRE
jgi:hypothetical protein